MSRILIPMLLLGVASCAPRMTEVALNTDTTPASTLMALVDASQNKLTSITGRGSITFESPSLAGSAYFDISVKKPDSLLARFAGPFGIDVGMFFLSRQKFVMYNSMQNELITGAPNAGAIRSVIPFDLTYEQILNAFTGTFAIEHQPGDLTGYIIDDDRFRLTFRNGATTSLYWVDPSTLTVTRYEVHDTAGRAIVEATASRVTEENGARAPRQIVVKFPEENRQLAISYTTIHLNTDELSFAYTIPASAHKIIR